MKKLINRPENVVSEMIDGLVSIYGGLARLSHHNVLIRRDIGILREHQVTLVSGGGSGHEPAHGGYLGPGMLSAAVAGEVFSSPSPESILAGIRAAAGPAGVLLIVKNYTGDRLNFGLAAEMARAEGIPTEMVVVADDIALTGTEQYAGARGIAGTVFVHKIAGAAAAQGKNLASVAEVARQSAASVATVGVALSAGTLPASGKRTFTLEEHEMELGLGIHGEPGVQRVSLRPANEIAADLVERLSAAQGFRENDRIAVMINNLGATTVMELAIFARPALAALAAKRVVIERVYAGSFMTSLDAAGVSISTLRVDAERLALLDAPTSAPAWPCGCDVRPDAVGQRTIQSQRPEPPPVIGEPSPVLAPAVLRACNAIEEARDRLTLLDQASGDGDLGLNLARGARALNENISRLERQSLPEALKTIALTLQNVVGGSSGALYGVLFLRAASALTNASNGGLYRWGSALVQGCAAVSEIGGAAAGDRTMLDALLPFATTLMEGTHAGKPAGEVLEAAAQAAEAGAIATARMLPRRGRASYLGERALGHQDAGAVAAAVWLRAVVSTPKIDSAL